MSQAMNRRAAAEYLGLSVSTLAKRAITGNSPLMRKLGRRVVYLKSDLDAWLDAHQRRSTSETSCSNAR
mgnify:CR=1 FL=1